MPAPEPWRNSIVRYADEDPEQLLANPHNPKIHPRTQADAVVGSLNVHGWIVPVIVNEVTQHVVDGHARIGEAIARGEPTVPVAYVNLTEEQERSALATFDAITSMAVTDQGMLSELLDGLSVDDAGLQGLLDSLAASTVEDPSAEWQGMPEYEQEDQSAAYKAIVNFACEEDMLAFEKLLGQQIPRNTRSLWYPAQDRANFRSQAYIPST